MFSNSGGSGTAFPPGSFVYDADDVPFGTVWWFLYAGISCLLVLFAGIMSGLTLGLMSLGLVDLEILLRTGSSTQKKQAGSFLSFISHFLILILFLFISFALLQLLFFLFFKNNTSCLLLCFFVMLVLWRYLFFYFIILHSLIHTQFK